MKTRLFNLLEKLRASYWLLPGMLVVMSYALALFVLWMDEQVFGQKMVSVLGFEYDSISGVQTLLSVIATSSMAAASVAFSITIVALTLASQQFGPRLLRNFMRDNTNQVVLGGLLGIYIYCLVVLAASSDHGDVPTLSVIVAMLLAITGVFLLVFFIHNVADGIHVNNLIAKVAEELNLTALRLYDNDASDEAGSDSAVDDSTLDLADIQIASSGYLQAINKDDLLALAVRQDAVIVLQCAAGDFLVSDAVLARISPAWRADDDQLVQAINAACLQGKVRTPEQDIQFLFDELLEVALRALSPGVNDPFTARDCIDRIADALVLVLKRRVRNRWLLDEDHKPRLYVRYSEPTSLMDKCFLPLITNGYNQDIVAIRIAEVCCLLSAHADEQESARLAHYMSELNKKTAEDPRCSVFAQQIKQLSEKLQA